MILTRRTLRTLINDVMLSEAKAKHSAKTRSGAEEKLLRSKLADLKTRRAKISGNTPADKGRKAAANDDIADIEKQLASLTESVNDGSSNSVIDAFRAKWPYDDSDPSMAELGEDAWSQQVDLACDDLTSYLEEIEGKLINGEYFG